MTGEPRINPHDPTAKRTADQSTQTAGGLHHDPTGRRPTPNAEVARGPEADDTLYRNDQDLYETPRRYEEEDPDPTMPSNDATLNTKI